MIDSLFITGHDTVILDATNVTRRIRAKWFSRIWDLCYHEFQPDAAFSKERAKLTAVSDKHYRDLCAAIDRMALQFETVTSDEGLVQF
jgi:hypothetical protein